ncbi:low-density lipoprotein receptor-related protein 4-like isoform X2 [Pecten maximus]|nr:low-density lipoprotein receptor-related protein 4-like isoform X2 [Pecten maximus]
MSSSAESDGIYHAQVRQGTIQNSNLVLESPNGEIIALAVDTHDSQLFWYDSSVGKNGIYRGSFQGSRISSVSSIVQYPEMFVTGLAVDWVIKHLYWADSVRSSVTVSDYSGQNRVIAVTSNLLLPRGLSLDPINRYLYIGDQGAHLIMKCTIDGIFTCEHITEASDRGIVWPNQLTTLRRNISWTDGWSNKVVMCSSDLSECEDTFIDTINLNTGNVTSLFGMIVTNSGPVVSTIDRFITISTTSGQASTISSQGNTYYIVSTDRQSQPPVATNPCANKGCSQLCFPDSLNQVRCSCSSLSDNVIATDGKTCQSATSVLLYADMMKGQVGLVSTTLKGHTVIAWSPQPRSLAYDPLTKMVYFSDSKYQAIYKVGLNGRSPAIFLSKGNSTGNVEAMTLDLQQRRLYFINRFDWEMDNTNITMARIEMAGLETDERVIIRQTEDAITDIEIIQQTTASFLYYCVGEPSPAVYKMSLDGRMKVLIKATGLTNPTRLSSNGGTLYVLDGRTLFMLSGDVESEHNVMDQAVSMASDSRYVYLGTGPSSMFKFDRNSEIAGNPVITEVNPVDILYVSTSWPGSQGDVGLCENSNLCKDENVCFKTNNPDIVRCKCPANRFNTPTDGSRLCTEPSKFMLVSDVDGIKMMSLDDPLRNVYTIVPNDEECNHYYGLATDGNRIFFGGYDGKILYTASKKGRDVGVLTILRDMTVLQIAYQDNTLYWTGHYDCFMYNGSVGGIAECKTYGGQLGGIFSIDVTIGSSSQQQVTTVVADIDDPKGVVVDSRYIYWSEGDVVKRLMLRNTTSAIVSQKSDVFTLQRNRQQTHLFLGGTDITFRRFASQDFGFDVLYSNVSNVHGIAVQGSLVFASDWNTRSVIQYDLRTYQTRLVADNFGRPGQIVVFGLENNIKEKPGKCQEVSSCSVVTNVTCQHDVDCVDGLKSKCCLTKKNNICTRECTPLVAETACNITFDDQPTFTWVYEKVTTGKCTTCRCTLGGQSECFPKKCPSLDGCGLIIKETGNCCPVCRDITFCERKPTIKDCPTQPMNVTLPATLPTDNLDEPTKVFLNNLQTVDRITAFSCNLQEIPDHSKTLTPSFLTWQMDAREVSLVAKDDNGISTCDMRIRILDKTAPVFTSSQNDTVVKVYVKDKNGGPVYWSAPIAYDNSGIKPTLNRTTPLGNGDTFPPGLHVIGYTATDMAGNSQAIKFYVNVSVIPDTTCTSPPFFHRGSMECYKGQDNILTCRAECLRDYVFQPDFVRVHTCVNRQWTPPYRPDFVSACIKPEPKTLKVSTPIEMNCHGNQNISKDVVDCLRTRLPCNTPNVMLCDREAISIKQTDTSTVVTVQVSGIVPYRHADYEQALEKMNRTLLEKASTVEKLFSTSELDRYCRSLGCSFLRLQDRTYKETCENGAVAHLIEGETICGKCPPGSRYLVTHEVTKCEYCGEGKYQEEEGQTDCDVCPVDRPHSKTGAFLMKHCNRNLAATESTIVSTVVGVLVGFIFLIIVLVAILLVVKRRRSRGQAIPRSHQNPVFNLAADDYDSIPADQNDPTYTGLTAAKADPMNPYEGLGNCTAVMYNKSSGNVDEKKDEQNPYNMIGETNPYDDLKSINVKPENPYEMPKPK